MHDMSLRVVTGGEVEREKSSPPVKKQSTNEGKNKNEKHKVTRRGKHVHVSIYNKYKCIHGEG